jgi:hypothetical protein
VNDYLLCQANYSYVYEVTSDESHALLIFTPESDSEVALIVDAFVSAAPMIPGWTIFNRRQRRAVEDALAMLEQVYDVDASDVVLSIRENSNSFDVAMYTKLAEILGEPEKEGFISFFLEHALGEAFAMKWIKRKEILLPGKAKLFLTPHVFVEQILSVSEKKRRLIRE